MDKLVDHLFVFEGQGLITDFPGNYSQYRAWQKDKEQLTGARQVTNQSITAMSERDVRGNTEVLTANRRKPSFKEKREFEILEKEIAALAREKEEITIKLNSGETPFDELQKLSLRIGEVTMLLDEKELRWLELSEVM
jgi:ABC transport system ATP-binding/permease protein